MFEIFDIDDKDIFKACVIATMSSGKSTFINSIIGEEIMPEKNEACTARTMAVLDNDSSTVKAAHIIRKNGAKEVVEIDGRDVLARINNDADVMDFLIETDIQSIANTSRALMLVDTPGVNNSEDVRHGERTKEFLKQMDMGVIIYLLNATQLATNDDSILLGIVSEHVKKQKGRVKIIFVINKIDALDLETESIIGTVRIAKEYIQKHGISNPVIYPLSALAAKILRMALYRKEMTKRELRKLEDIYEHYRSKDNNMLAYAMLDDLSDEVYAIGEEEITAQELQRAIDNTGITAIERKLEDFMDEAEQHYIPRIVIKSQLSESAAQQFQERIEAISVFPTQCEWEKFKAINTKLESMEALQKRNSELPGIDSVSARIDILPELTAASTDINELIGNIEDIKKSVFEIFAEEKYVLAKRTFGLYFCPEKDEKSYINIKNFYLMSEDGNQWNAVRFECVTKLLDEGKEFYLYNEYAAFIFKATKENNLDVIALLDIRIPVCLVKLAGQNAAQLSLDEVEAYIKQIAEEEENRQREIQNAEEQLKRTYKGIVFETEKAKNAAIEMEEGIREYCKTLADKDFEELWNKKEQIAKLPNAIFAPYLAKFLSVLTIQESKEKNIYIDRVRNAEIDDLLGIHNELQNRHYSEAVKSAIDAAISKRRIQCQQIILEDMTEDIADYNRETLKKVAISIQEKEFDDNLTNEYVSRVQRQYDAVEMKELRELCAEIEQRDIQELEELESLIKAKGYQGKFTAQYFDMIHLREEFLHVKKLEEYCKALSAADREKLKEIREKVDTEACRLDLKNKFYGFIEQREEQLDYEDLCALTNHIEDKSLDELEKLYKQLKTGNYNDRFIKQFLLQVRVKLESAQQQYMNELTDNLQNMNKEQVLEAGRQIEKCGYADRIAMLAKNRIEERLYILDMYELMTLNNNFDGLSLNDIENLRNQLELKNVCERSRRTYLKKLKEREIVIAYQKVSQAACFAKQMLEQYGISSVNIKVAAFASDYMLYLERYFSDGGRQDFGNIPVIFFPECSSLAITKTDIYYKINSKYTKTALSDVRAFSIEKKLFTEALAVTLTNGNVFTLSGGINKKKSQAIAGFLTAIVQNINNESVLLNYQEYKAHVAELDENDFEMLPVIEKITEQNIVNSFLRKYKELSQSEKAANIKYAFQDNWEAAETKVRKGFGIINESRIILYYDRTLFNSAKEGIAIGCSYIHIKNASQGLVSIPYTDIYDVSQNSNQIIITTITNNIFLADFAIDSQAVKNGIAALLDEYVKGIQLICSSAERTIAEDIELEAVGQVEGKCPNCKAILRIGAKFCSNCGMKAAAQEPQNAIDYIFCSECGNKIMKGKKFCSNCGVKVY